MFKRIVTIMVASCFVASFAYAETTAEISGEYSATGTYMDENDINYQYYSHELDLFATFTNEGTMLTTEFGIVDKTWGDETVADDGGEIEIDKVWLTHKFGNGFKLDFGKMTEGTWGTMLGDADDGYYGVKVAKSFGDTTIVGFLEKIIENGASEPIEDDNEKDDGDAAYIGLIQNLGDISLMPKIAYEDRSDLVDDKGSDGVQTLTLVFAALGKVGDLSFETEFNYIDVSSDTIDVVEYSVFNLWADANIDFGPVNTGLSLAYGTEDNGKGAGTFGTDFCPMILMDNDDGTIDGLGAMMFAKVYASTVPIENLTTGCAFAYGDGEKDAWGTSKASIYEFDITADYAITEALSYSASIAYADVDALDDTILQLEHEFIFSF